MTKPDTVVAATDFSDCARHAAHRAALLAAQLGAALTLLHVVNRSFLASLQDMFGSPAQAGQALTLDAARTGRAAGVRLRVVVSAPHGRLDGDPIGNWP